MLNINLMIKLVSAFARNQYNYSIRLAPFTPAQ